MKKLFIIILIFMVAVNCHYEPEDREVFFVDYDEAMVAAISAWEEHVSPVSEECADLMEDYEIVEVERGYETPCGDDPRIEGCHVKAWYTIFIVYDLTEKRTNVAMVHEWTHALGWCEENDPDAKHVDELLWGEEDSVVALGVSILENIKEARLK